MRLLHTSRKIFEAALAASHPSQCISDHLIFKNGTLCIKGSSTCFVLSSFKNIIVVGAGKATVTMAEAVLDILAGVSPPISGIISVKYGHGKYIAPLQVMEGGHPYPDAAGCEAAQMIFSLVANADKNDLIISLISGGGSALLPLPAGDISLDEKIKTTELLLACGADIYEVNTVRKHISRIKGGQLAVAAYPAPVCNLLLSDVLGDRPDVIASGPFVPDNSSFVEAKAVLQKYNLFKKVPRNVRMYIDEGCTGKHPETPKEKDRVFTHVHTRIIGSNRLFLEAAKKKAKELGFHTVIITSSIKGEARELGVFLSAMTRELRQHNNPVTPPACILIGGETTVSLRGNGKGGRNQECCLAAVKGIAGLKDVIIFCAGTDGTDGPTDAAGAFCTGDTLEMGKKKEIEPEDYLRRNDSYHYFQQVGNLILTGPTGTNLMDIYMILVG
jgi:glycerate 2-kinase